MKLFSNLLLTAEDEEVSNVLKDINLFKELTPFERAKIAKYFRKKIYEAGDQIIKEGTPGDGMFVIQQGAVKVAKKLKKGKEQVLENMVDGDFFGELALLDGAPRSASVYAISRVTMYELYRASLQELVRKEPEIGVKILYKLARILGDRIRASGNKIRDILVWKSLNKKH